jgi:GTP cyclohydrolase II|tara:strand:- start:1319 stop:1492 length:174 start_codon:yes stop_codon:yes gene_type:complete
MRYKDLVSRNLDQISNRLNNVKHHAMRGEKIEVNQVVDDIKEMIDQTQTYLNNETQE